MLILKRHLREEKFLTIQKIVLFRIAVGFYKYVPLLFLIDFCFRLF